MSAISRSHVLGASGAMRKIAPKDCCNQDCNSGRDCPLKPSPGESKAALVILGFAVAVMAVILLTSWVVS